MCARERVENAFARHARAILLGREQGETAVVSLHDEVRRVLGGIAVVVGKCPSFCHCNARGNGGLESHA